MREATQHVMLRASTLMTKELLASTCRKGAAPEKNGGD